HHAILSACRWNAPAPSTSQHDASPTVVADSRLRQCATESSDWNKCNCEQHHPISHSVSCVLHSGLTRCCSARSASLAIREIHRECCAGTSDRFVLHPCRVADR